MQARAAAEARHGACSRRRSVQAADAPGTLLRLRHQLDDPLLEAGRKARRADCGAARIAIAGAGAVGRISLGLSVLSGIIASTCLAVLFVPSFFAVLQGFEEWRKARKKAPAAAAPRPAE